MKTYDSHIERAQAAIEEFNKLAPMLTSFARAFTDNPLIKVVPQIGSTMTDGKFIFIEPPLALADQVEHDESLCNRHDGAMRALCPSCGVREEVLVKTFHEIAHNWAGSFEDVPEADKARAVTDAAKAMGIDVPQDVLDEVREATLRGQTITYDSIARVISPYLDILVNALEDARVNARMGEARPGFERMRQGDEYETLFEGLRKINPETGEECVTKFGERSIDFQAAIGLYRKASGFPIPPDTHVKVTEALDDERLSGIYKTAVHSKNVRGPYDGAVRALEILREYGLMGGKEPEPEPEEEDHTPGLPSEEETGNESDQQKEGDDGGAEDDQHRGDAGDGTSDESEAESEDGAESEADDEHAAGDPSGEGGSAGEAAADDRDADSSDDGEAAEGQESQGDQFDAAEGQQYGDDSSTESDDAEGAEGSDAADPGGEPGGDEKDGASDSANGSPGDDGEEGEETHKQDDASGDTGDERKNSIGRREAADDAAGEQSDTGEGSDDQTGLQDDAGEVGSDGGEERTDGGREDEGPSSGDQAADGSEPDESGEQGSSSSGGDSTGGGQEGGREGDSSDDAPGGGSEVGTGPDVGDPGSRGRGDGSPQPSPANAAGDGDDTADAVGDDDGGRKPEGADLDDRLGEGDSGADADGNEGSGKPDHLDVGVDYKKSAADENNGEVSSEDASPDGDESVIEDHSGGDPDADPLDAGEFDNGWVATAHDPSMKDDAPLEIRTAEEVAHESEDFFGHDHKHANDDESIEARQALIHVMSSGIFFDMIPRNVAGVRWHRYDKHVTEEWVDSYGERKSKDWAGAWTHDYLMSTSGTGRYNKRVFGIDGDFRPPEAILGAAVQKARIVFANNARTKEVRNLKAGKINTRVLGRRAPVRDPRLFAKKERPGRRNYFVVLGGDASLSTTGTAIVLIKRAIMAQAEVLHRLGIPFEVIMHSADTARGVYSGQRRDGYEVDMYLIKEGSEPWNDEARRRLEAIGPDSNNLDGHTIQLYRKRLDARNETDRILMYYTDGRMPALNGAEEAEVLRRELKIFDAKGYKLMCVGVNTSSPEAWGLSTVRVEEDRDLIKVIQHLEKALMQ